MNCIIERRRAEELLDTPERMMPFGFQINSEPKKRITGERMAIFCESGSAVKWVKASNLASLFISMKN